ncbi:related to SED5-binding protein 3 [Saccharomycodes ludwigii]|uniref:Related to SED5-binding protein 3 n=1 Tax=Saccharomycodes ludwigii TaxID=36035 RepID=A0A376B3R9_9ASCO|nr:hypothetical protein SCDLUD_004701 [Saccharomycodes ludwigii]KAH3899266.1 hypothetical protein SCDLUD_004701 [Saccharomycodes ludwigii]SSD59301.1 related to SED5-binding protein 3 [Saccharomycodes ludwigii]
MNELPQNISNLSLNSPQQPGNDRPASTHTRKKKPARAYYNLNGNNTSVSSLSINNSAGTTTPIINSMSGIMNNNGSSQRIITPVASNTPTTNTTNYDLPTERLVNQQEYLYKTFDTTRDSVLPLKTTEFYGLDTGSCDPRLMSLTMYNVPKDEQLRSATKLPLGVVMQPFADISTLVTVDSNNSNGNNSNGFDNEEAFDGTDGNSSNTNAIPTIEQNIGLLRCNRCRAYNNPHFKFNYENTYQCNFCKVKTNNPLQFQPPPITQGFYEFDAPDAYNHVTDNNGGKNQPLHYFFLIDISTFANANKSSLSVIEAVRSSIEYISHYQPHCKVGIMAFDKNLHFFKLSAHQDTAQEFIVGDLYGDTRNNGNEEGSVFLPFYEGLFVSPADGMYVIEDTLQKLQQHCSSKSENYNTEVEVCYGPALEAATLALATFANGGKVLCSLNSLPMYSRGTLKFKKDDNLKKNLKCDNPYYVKVSRAMLKKSVGIDLFITTDGFMDLCTVGYPSYLTGGFLKHYPHFQPAKDEFQLCHDYLTSCSNTVGYQAQWKLRCSNGLNVYNYYSESSDESDKPPFTSILSKTSNISVLLKYDDDVLKHGKDCYFQAAVLYTNLKGERKIRVVNTTGAVSSNIFEIFKFVNQDNIVNIMVKDVLRSLREDASDYSKVRNTIDNKLVDIFTQYRALTGGGNTQMVLPESLKTLPTYMLAFESSKLMKNTNHSTRGNERVVQYYDFLTSSPSRLNYRLYPQIIPLHTLMSENDLTFYDENDTLLSVESISSLSVGNSYRKLIDGGCYVIFQGDLVYIWFNTNTNKMLLQDLLGVSENINDISKIHIESGIFPILDTAINIKARNLMLYWRRICNYHRESNFIKVLPLRPQYDDYYSNVMQYDILFEDKNIEMVESLENYLLFLHKKIKERMDKEDYIKVGKSNKVDNETFTQRYLHI